MCPYGIQLKGAHVSALRFIRANTRTHLWIIVGADPCVRPSIYWADTRVRPYYVASNFVRS